MIVAKTPTFATGKSRWLSRKFFYTYLRIATSGLRQQSGRKVGKIRNFESLTWLWKKCSFGIF